MHLSISAVGFATAQGGSADLLSRYDLRDPEEWPWPVNEWTASRVCRTAIGVDSKLSGLARWRALVQMALADCFGDQMPAGNTPIFLASCNGGADGFDLSNWNGSFDSTNLLEGTPWSGKALPVFSSSCN